MIANSFYLVCAGLSCIILAIHVFLGGPEIARPMRDCPNLNRVVRLTNYYCWHLVTISLAQLAVLFGWAAFTPAAAPLAVIGTATAGAFCIWGIALVIKTKQKYRHMPQGLLFLPVAIIGLVGLFS